MVLSTKVEVMIDEEDLAKFEQYSGSGALIKLKEAIVNPSFVVAIVKDKNVDFDLPRLMEPERKMTKEEKEMRKNLLKKFTPDFVKEVPNQ